MEEIDRYKVWVHIEALNADGDQILGDDCYEPHEAACCDDLNTAEGVREVMLDVADLWLSTNPGDGK